MNSIILRSGARMPIIGFGTFTGMKTIQQENAYKATLSAIEAGYRHIDTAQFYGTEKYVGQAIKDSGLPRNEIFINTKLYNSCYSPKLVEMQLEKSLEDLQVDYLDSWLMHTPWSFVPKDPEVPSAKQKTDENRLPIENLDYDLLETWNVISSFSKKGYARDIGVSNFNEELVDLLVDNGDVLPSVNQVEAHPYFNNEKLRIHCSKRGVAMTAYGPLGGPGETSKVNGYTLLNNPTVNAIAEKYNKGPGQIILKFQAQRGVAAIPKSVTPSRIAANIDLFDFDLTNEDLNDLLALDGPHNRAYAFDRAAKVGPKHGPQLMFK